LREEEDIFELARLEDDGNSGDEEFWEKGGACEDEATCEAEGILEVEESSGSDDS
jgi:hypothetical protein